MISTPVRYSPSIEDVNFDEAQTIEQLNETFDRILETTAQDYGHAVRSVHAKAHGVLERTLTVDAGLPPELSHGLFAAPGEHKVYMRLSTNAGRHPARRDLAAARPCPQGARCRGRPPAGRGRDDAGFWDGQWQGVPDQDRRSVPGQLKKPAKTTDRLEGTKTVISSVLRGVNTALEAIGIESTTLASLGGAPNVGPLGETYYSVTPFRYGDYIAKFSMAPVASALKALTGKEIEAADRDNAIRDTVQDEMRAIEGEWEFRVQLCRDSDMQPVEDPTVEWKEDEAPFQRVATIRVKPQDSWDSARVEAVNEKMRFSVWTGLAAHQPLGTINRARNGPYQHSAKFRGRFNSCPIHEPAAS